MKSENKTIDKDIDDRTDHKFVCKTIESKAADEEQLKEALALNVELAREQMGLIEKTKESLNDIAILKYIAIFIAAMVALILMKATGMIW